MARVWPNIFVEPANLTVHMSALRRALRDGRDGHRFIVNIPGRGYCFVASGRCVRIRELSATEPSIRAEASPWSLTTAEQPFTRSEDSRQPLELRHPRLAGVRSTGPLSVSFWLQLNAPTTAALTSCSPCRTNPRSSAGEGRLSIARHGPSA